METKRFYNGHLHSIDDRPSPLPEANDAEKSVFLITTIQMGHCIRDQRKFNFTHVSTVALWKGIGAFQNFTALLNILQQTKLIYCSKEVTLSDNTYLRNTNIFRTKIYKTCDWIGSTYDMTVYPLLDGGEEIWNWDFRFTLVNYTLETIEQVGRHE